MVPRRRTRCSSASRFGTWIVILRRRVHDLRSRGNGSSASVSDPVPASVSEALVRIRNIRRTVDKEDTSISQRKLLEGRRAREDEVCGGVENVAVPSELDVQFGIAKGQFGKFENERFVVRPHRSQDQFPREVWEVLGPLLVFGGRAEVIPEVQRLEAREVDEERQQTIQRQHDILDYQRPHKTANRTERLFHRGWSEPSE